MPITYNQNYDGEVQAWLPSAAPHQQTESFEAFAPRSTLGILAVERNDRMISHLIEGSQIEDELRQHLAAKERIEGKLTPYDGAIVYTLGRLARRSASMEDWKIVSDPFRRPDTLQSTASFHADEYHTGYDKNVDELDKIRQSIETLSESQSVTLDTYMHDNASPFLVVTKDIHTPVVDRNWQDWLSKKATNDQLMNVLQWHTYVSGEQLSYPEIYEQIAEKKAAFATRIPQMVDLGVLAPDAIDAIDAIDDIEVRIEDVFDTIIKGRAGYYVPGTKHITIQQGVGPTPEIRYASLTESINEVTFHELTHALLACAYGKGSPAMDARWLNEALTERIGQLFKKLDTTQDYNGVAAYAEEDRLLERVLCGMDGEGVDINMATRAYTGGERELDEFMASVDAVWGTENALGKIAHAVEVCEDLHALDGEKQERVRQVKALQFVELVLRTSPKLAFASE